MARIEIVHWNPVKSVLPGRLGRRLPIGRRVNNFGDLLGPVIVAKMLGDSGIALPRARRRARLLSVGSIMHFAKTNDVIWGTGVNGKKVSEPFRPTSLDVRAVRGPETRDFLTGRGFSVPEIYGDPGLLVGSLWSRSSLAAQAVPRTVSIVPNFHEFDPAMAARYEHYVNPQGGLWDCLSQIAASQLVVGSSLHGIVVAESLGIPARLISSGAEPSFKYDDYYGGSGRSSYEPATSIDQAIAMGGEPAPDFDSARLMQAFPLDLWNQRHDNDLALEEGLGGTEARMLCPQCGGELVEQENPGQEVEDQGGRLYACSRCGFTYAAETFHDLL